VHYNSNFYFRRPSVHILPLIYTRWVCILHLLEREEGNSGIYKFYNLCPPLTTNELQSSIHIMLQDYLAVSHILWKYCTHVLQGNQYMLKICVNLGKCPVKLAIHCELQVCEKSCIPVTFIFSEQILQPFYFAK
jgi:hypothetical protein